MSSDTLVVDCSASGISRKPQVPVWSGNRITVQMIRTCQPTFSAALIGFIEATFADPEQKNALCQPVPSPVIDTDWLRMLAVSTRNRALWRAHPNIEEWLLKSRLNTLFAAPARVKPEETGKDSPRSSDCRRLPQPEWPNCRNCWPMWARPIRSTS